MRVSLSIRDALFEQLRAVSTTANVSDSSVTEIALRRLFATGTTEQIAMTVIQEGASQRRFTRKTWLDAFYSRLRDIIPAEHRTGRSGFEFMNYDVLVSSERENDPSRIVIHTMEANLPIGIATSYNGSLFSYTLESAPSVAANDVIDWLRSQK